MLRSIGLPELIVLVVGVLIIVMVFRNLKKGNIVGFAAAGAILGAVLGFLFRPSVPLVGQLPFDVVLTRGANLNGLDMFLRSAAEQSFNYLLVGAVLGALLMAGARTLISQRVPVAPASVSMPVSASVAADSSMKAKAFCTKCGTAFGTGDFCGSCGTRREGL